MVRPIGGGVVCEMSCQAKRKKCSRPPLMMFDLLTFTTWNHMAPFLGTDLRLCYFCTNPMNRSRAGG